MIKITGKTSQPKKKRKLKTSQPAKLTKKATSVAVLIKAPTMREIIFIHQTRILLFNDRPLVESTSLFQGAKYVFKIISIEKRSKRCSNQTLRYFIILAGICLKYQPAKTKTITPLLFLIGNKPLLLL